MFITSQWLSLELFKKFAHLQFRIDIVDCLSISRSPQAQYLGQTDPASCGHLSAPGDLCTEFADLFIFFSKIEFEYWNIHQSRWNSCKNLIFNHKCDQLSNPFSHKTLFRDQCFGYLGLHTILQEICVQIFFILSFDRIRGSHFLVKIQIMRWFPITSFPITYRARYLNYVLAKLAEKMNHSWKIWNPLKTTSVTLNSIVTVRKRSGKSMLTSKISQTEFYGS